MDPYSSISKNLHQLEEIANQFKQDELNDGEAGFLRDRVQSCLSNIRHELAGAKVITASRYNELKSELKNIDHLYQKVFENEHAFEAIKETHESYNALKTEIEIKNKSPDLINSIHIVKTAARSYTQANERDHLFFDPERNRFVGTNRPQDEPREVHIRTALNVIHNHLKAIDERLETLSSDLTENEVFWINLQLEGLQGEVVPLYEEAGTVEVEEFPSVFRYASEIFTKREASPEAEEMGRLIDESMGTLAASDFSNIEEMGKLAVGFHQFDPLLESDEMQQIGRYLNDNIDDIFGQLETVAEAPSGDKSIYLRKEVTGLPRTLQVLLPEEGLGPDDLLFIVQLKRHGVMPLDQEGLKLFMQQVTEGVADPLEPSDKGLPVIGKGAFKAAKHSLTFPRLAISEDGVVDPEQVVHSTTLTPNILSKGHIQQCLTESGVYIDTPVVKKTVDMLGKKARRNIEQEVKHHKKFQGPGVLPLIGSSQYEGSYKFEEPSIIKSLFGVRRECLVNFSKSNVVTIKCDGDLEFNPDKKFTLEEKKKIAEDVITGMIRIHEMRFKHGDMKPQNILFLRDEEGVHAFLCDFGLSGLWDSSGGGTPIFLPVNMLGFPIDSPQYDVYAMGLTLLGLFTNCHVYSPLRQIMTFQRQQRAQIKAILDNPILFALAVKQQGVTEEELREMCDRFLQEDKSTFFLEDRYFLRNLFLDESLDAKRPLLSAFVKVFFVHYAQKANSMTEEECARLFGHDSDMSPDADLTIPLLENLLKEIQAVEVISDPELTALTRRI